jgi:hypothetical protein
MTAPKIQSTAKAMVMAFDEKPDWFAAEFHAAVERLGGDSSYIQDAAKFLRNSGVLVVAKKARQNSRWFLATRSFEIAEWEERVRNTHFSELLSQARSLAKARSKTIVQARNRVMGNAINLGIDMGYSPSEVIQMCDPLTTLPKSGSTSLRVVGD